MLELYVITFAGTPTGCISSKSRSALCHCWPFSLARILALCVITFAGSPSDGTFSKTRSALCPGPQRARRETRRPKGRSALSNKSRCALCPSWVLLRRALMPLFESLNHPLDIIVDV